MNKILLAVFMSLTALLCSSSATTGGPRAEVVEAKKAPDGTLIFGLKIYAAKSEALSLSHPAPPIPAGQERVEGDDDPVPFSLAECVLTDTASQAEYKALPLLPSTPFLAPMETTANLAPGAWTTLAVAFPAIPPSQTSKGKNTPMALSLAIPSLKIQTSFQLDLETLKIQSRKP
jgi:hypothetical protein